MRRMGRSRQLLVRSLSASARLGWLQLGAMRFRCALGGAGQRVLKREGDGATPIGCWHILDVRYRADRLPRPGALLPVKAIRPLDGWCDSVGDRNYNRPIRHPYAVSAERLWRQDGLYDIVVVLGYNDRPRVQGRGSAIFMHVAHPDWLPTAGCIALMRSDLILLLRHLDRHSIVRIRR